MNKWIVVSLVVAVVAVATWLMRKDGSEMAGPTATPTPTVSPTPTPTPATPLVTYTDSGYSPATVTVKKGETVTWKNNSSHSMWTASALHPTHSIYPTTGGCLGSTFDACAGIAAGATWSFKFDAAGTWKYHNHVDSSHYGTVIVE